MTTVRRIRRRLKRGIALERESIPQIERHDDPRVRRTRKALRSGLLELAEQKDFAEITASEIARYAGVNRNTFYVHYRDKQDLLMDAMDELFAEITASTRVFVETAGILHPGMIPPEMNEQLAAFDRHRGLLRRLLSEHGSQAFSARLRTFHAEFFLEIWRNQHVEVTKDGAPPEFRAEYVASAMEGALRWWLEHGQSVSYQHIATWLWKNLQPIWFGDVTRTEENRD